MAEYYPQRPFTLPPDATEVVLVRHGSSAPAEPGKRFELVDGHGDPPLAPDGHAQAEAVARRLGGSAGDLRPTALFTTGLTRTVQTAAPLAKVLGLEPAAIPELREVRLGDWEGGEFRMQLAEGHEIAMAMLAAEDWSLIPGAETMESLAARVTAGVERIVAAAEPGTRVAAFVHGGIVGEICRQATSSRPFAFIHSDNCSITRLVVFGDGRWLLRGFNDITHLG